MANKLETVEKAPLKQGKKELLKHLEGGSLSPGQAIRAKCYECTAYYSDGPHDCEMPDCPLHPFMVYNKERKKKHTPWAKGNLESLEKARKVRKAV